MPIFLCATSKSGLLVGDRKRKRQRQRQRKTQTTTTNKVNHFSCSLYFSPFGFDNLFVSCLCEVCSCCSMNIWESIYRIETQQRSFHFFFISSSRCCARNRVLKATSSILNDSEIGFHFFSRKKKENIFNWIRHLNWFVMYTNHVTTNLIRSNHTMKSGARLYRIVVAAYMRIWQNVCLLDDPTS